MGAYAELTPVNVLTGFLGSGKTTLLQRLLRSPSMARTAVLINEFGEVGLDHLLVRQVDESMVLLQSGCICCTIRDDLNGALRNLLSKRERGEIPSFNRVVIETTGLADPAPILYTLFAEPVLRHHYRLGAVVTTVDAVNAQRHIEQHPEGYKQVAVADSLVLTKTDIAEPAATLSARKNIARTNPAASVFDARQDNLDADQLLSSDPYDPALKDASVQSWLQQSQRQIEHQKHHGNSHGHEHDRSRHGDIASFSLVFDHPLDWIAFGVWLTMLLNRHGENVLRVKGILNVGNASGPVVINGVQHLVHPPAHLDDWPSRDRTSRIVFITRGMDAERIRRSLAAFCHIGQVTAHVAA